MPQAYSNKRQRMENSTPTSKLAAELKDVSVVYGVREAAVHAAKGVSLEVRRGELLLLMGPSGSGKSTVLQVLGCIRYATAGTVLIDGKSIAGLTENALSRLRCEHIGFVFQHYNLLPSLRAWENVALALELRGESGAGMEKTSRAMLARLGLEHRADAYPQQLSGGQKQRVAIARAVVGRPGIILADEPTAALDSASGADVARLLASVAHENDCAVVVVTHDARITGIADRLAYLDDGAILWTRKNVQLQDKSLRESGIHETNDHGRGSLDASFIRRAASNG
jgi:putative ABC transport system ATP-binding protein